MEDKSNLGRLIEQQKTLNDLSDQQIVDRAIERGERLGKSNLGRVRAGDNPSITRSTIFGLAAGLGVTPSTVATAALADMGIVLTEGAQADAESAVKRDPTLPEWARRLVLTLLGELREQAREMDARRDRPARGAVRITTTIPLYQDEASQPAGAVDFAARRREMEKRGELEPPEFDEMYDAARTENDYISSGKRAREHSPEDESQDNPWDEPI